MGNPVPTVITDASGNVLATVPVTISGDITNVATTVADGANVAQGATTDVETASGNGSGISIWKRIRTLLGGGLPSALVSNRLPVDGSGVTQPVSGTDGALATIGVTTDAESASGNGTLVAILKRLRTLLGGGLPSALVSNRLVVDGSGVTQPVSQAGTTLASTTTPLAGGGVYLPATFDVTPYSLIEILIVSNVPSAVDGLQLWWIDSTAALVELTDIFAYVPIVSRSAAGYQAFTLQVVPKASKLRLYYINGASAQATFSVSIIGRSAGSQVAAAALRSASLGTDYLRHPDVFKTVQTAATGDTAIWTPSNAVLRWRLLKYSLEVSDNATLAAGGVLTVTLRDATTGLNLSHDIYVPAVALVNNGSLYSSGLMDMGGFGILSAAANQALNVNLSAALLTGSVRVRAWGVEE